MGISLTLTESGSSVIYPNQNFQVRTNSALGKLLSITRKSAESQLADVVNDAKHTRNGNGWRGVENRRDRTCYAVHPTSPYLLRRGMVFSEACRNNNPNDTAPEPQLQER